jgi:hypothetical protein
MPTDADPVVGRWYQQLEKGERFEVIAFDEDNGLVEVQHFDGDVEEIDIDAWYDMDLEPIEPPQDWTGPIDDVQRDDLGYTETGSAPEGSPRQKREPPPRRVLWEEEPEEGEWDEGEGGEEPYEGDER